MAEHGNKQKKINLQHDGQSTCVFSTLKDMSAEVQSQFGENFPDKLLKEKTSNIFFSQTNHHVNHPYKTFFKLRKQKSLFLLFFSLLFA